MEIQPGSSKAYGEVIAMDYVYKLIAGEKIVSNGAGTGGLDRLLERLNKEIDVME